MKLSGDQYERLHMVLRDRFADYAALAFFLRTQLDVSLEEISGDQGLFTVAIAVIGEAEAKRWVDALLERLHQQFPGDPTVAALCAELKAATGGAGAAADPFSTRYLWGRAPFLGRADVRRILKSLVQDHATACVVTGEQKSGKTTTSDYIQHLRKAGVGFDVFEFRLSRLTSTSAVSLAEAIATRLGLDPSTATLDGCPLFESNEQATRWASAFGNWLVGRLSTRDTPFWLVFDDCEDFVRDDTRALLDVLVGLAGRDIPAMRMVLLHMALEDLPCSQDYQFGLEQETIEVPGTQAVTDFFEHEYLLRNADTAPRLSDADLARHIVASVQAVQQATEAAVARGTAWLAALQAAVAAEAQAVRECPLVPFS